jgi:ParB/RepB/Spo0J family partition protein
MKTNFKKTAGERLGHFPSVLGAARDARARSGEEVPVDAVEVQIDPAKTRMNPFHGRWASTSSPEAVSALAASFKVTGQTQPAKGYRVAKGDDGVEIELIYGARRRAAALVAGTKLRVLIVDRPKDATIAREMHNENRERADYKPLEQAMEYSHYIEAGLYGSVGELAEGLGEDPSKVSRLLSIASLPKTVLDLYATDVAWMTLVNGAKLASECARGADVKKRVVEAAKLWKSEARAGNPTKHLLQAAKGETVQSREPVTRITAGGREIGQMRGGAEPGEDLRIVLAQESPPELRAELLAVLAKYTR